MNYAYGLRTTDPLSRDAPGLRTVALHGLEASRLDAALPTRALLGRC